jgi:hypothetical protein
MCLGLYLGIGNFKSAGNNTENKPEIEIKISGKG